MTNNTISKHTRDNNKTSYAHISIQAHYHIRKYLTIYCIFIIITDFYQLGFSINSFKTRLLNIPFWNLYLTTLYLTLTIIIGDTIITQNTLKKSFQKSSTKDTESFTLIYYIHNLLISYQSTIFIKYLYFVQFDDSQKLQQQFNKNSQIGWAIITQLHFGPFLMQIIDSFFIKKTTLIPELEVMISNVAKYGGFYVLQTCMNYNFYTKIGYGFFGMIFSVLGEIFIAGLFSVVYDRVIMYTIQFFWFEVNRNHFIIKLHRCEDYTDVCDQKDHNQKKNI